MSDEYLKKKKQKKRDDEINEIEQLQDQLKEHKLKAEKLDDFINISNLYFDLKKSKNNKEIENNLINLIKEFGSIGFYNEILIKNNLIKKDDKLINDIKNNNKNKLKELDNKLIDAKENFGQVEVTEAQINLANFKSAITSNKLDILTNYNDIENLTSSKKIELAFQKIKFSLFWDDMYLIKKNIDEANEYMETAGDWDKRNRLKVFQGIYSLYARDYNTAANNFLDVVATFSSYEYCSFQKFIFWTVLSSLVSLDRVTLKKKVIDASEVLSILHEMPNLSKLLNSFYDCDYILFFQSMVNIKDELENDRFFSLHLRWYFRELRIKAYSQFLESFKSVTLKSMADSFGVSVEFIDKEISQFIASKRLTATIDKVEGIIETQQKDLRNQQFDQIIRNGDNLLNKLQKLARSIEG